jgi:NhaA family Na+:H+ antiporter
MIYKITKMFKEFLENKKAGGFLLILCTAVSMIVANSGFGDGYIHFWHSVIGFNLGSIDLNYSVEYWINDGLMAIFFLLVGLEIERELYVGELSDIKNAMLPVFAAAGGMLIPALLHFSFNAGTDTQSGIGIPMATDIAFALGVLSLLGSRIPVSVKIFLTALAIIDDLGAIIVIALFYTKGFSVIYFALALSVFIILLVLRKLKVMNLIFYIIPGILMWFFMLKSGIHPTITGVLLAFAIPFRNANGESPSVKLEHSLIKPVSFLILPVFALANTGIIFSAGWYEGILSNNSLGIITGLVLGKPVGIIIFSYIAIKTKLGNLPSDINFKHITGAGILAGIGFTMSIFITLLAFDDASVIVNSKIAVLLASLISGTVGYLLLRSTAVSREQ